MNRLNDKQKMLIAIFGVYQKYNKDTDLNLEEIKSYSLKRLDNCIHIGEDIFCGFCEIQCFGDKYKKEIRSIMRFSGPRMILYHPIMAIRYLKAKIKCSLV